MRPAGLLARLRGHLGPRGPGARIAEPLAAWCTWQRGLFLPTLRYVRRRGLAVRSGPLRGLRYPRSRFLEVEDLVAKLAGSYEAELHPALERVIARRPGTIVVLGAGEGLYAVGLARRCQGADLIAFERDARRGRICAALASENGVGSRLELRGECTLEELAGIDPGPGTLVVSDCEGAERELINPAAVTWLADAALLIEVHESFDPSIAPALNERLAATHVLEPIAGAPRYLEEHSALWEVPGLSAAQAAALMTELRPWRTSWLLALPARGAGAPADRG